MPLQLVRSWSRCFGKLLRGLGASRLHLGGGVEFTSHVSARPPLYICIYSSAQRYTQYGRQWASCRGHWCICSGKGGAVHMVHFYGVSIDMSTASVITDMSTMSIDIP
eukprot:361176-Chlamydomonas_euryale.AAC.5